MNEKPIIFSGPMIAAIREGTKVMTRRVLCKQPRESQHFSGEFLLWTGRNTATSNRRRRDEFDRASGRLLKSEEYLMPLAEWLLEKVPWKVGQRLWVRETWNTLPLGKTFYAADGPMHKDWKWRSPIHMPRSLSRITLEVTAVKVERLSEISETDCYGEGRSIDLEMDPVSRPGAAWFRDLWESLHGDGSWERNPWVAAISFKRVEAPAVPLPAAAATS